MAQYDDIKILKQRAAEDLLVAEIILDNDHELLAQIGFHLQQFLEKRMKVILQENHIDYPKTHDLAILLRLFPQKKINADDKEFMYILSQFAVESRYDEYPQSPWDGRQMLDKTKKFAELIETVWVGQ